MFLLFNKKVGKNCPYNNKKYGYTEARLFTKNSFEIEGPVNEMYTKKKANTKEKPKIKNKANTKKDGFIDASKKFDSNNKFHCGKSPR